MKGGAPASAPAAAPAGVPAALLDFVLRQAKIQTHVCTRQRFQTGYQLPRRTVPDYNLIHVRVGRVDWVIGETVYPMTPGDWVLVPPGVPHHGASRTQRMDLVSLHVEVTLPDGQDVFGLLRPPTAGRAQPHSRLAAYLAGFAAEFERSDRLMIDRVMPGWGRMITLELLWQEAGQGRLGYQPVEPLVILVLEELQRRLETPVTQEDLARWSGYSPQHLNRLFRQALGVTPLQHLTRVRMERAAELLGDDRLSVAAIARRVGFEDAYYFSRLFKKHHRLSPAHYRQSLQGA